MRVRLCPVHVALLATAAVLALTGCPLDKVPKPEASAAAPISAGPSIQTSV